MHPPLDRPHPDCQVEIGKLHECHRLPAYQRYFMGACNDLKVQLDQCLKREKQRHLEMLMNQEMVQAKHDEETMIQKAFGKRETFAEYLQRDADYQEALRQKKEQRVF